MSTSKAQSKVRLVRSENKWGRSNRRHFARQNCRKKTSDQYEKKFKKIQLSQFRACPSGYTRDQGWNCLFRAWLGYKISKNPKNGESFQDRLGWAITIQNIQTDMGLQRSSFPNLGLLGDSVFTYDLEKELELQTEHDELWFKEYKNKKRAHIQEIVNGSMLTEQEKEWMEEYASQVKTGIQVERIVFPNFFDMRAKNYHKESNLV
jgi:nitrogenase molybdenum-iron protein alpha/beta subunit